MKDNLKPDDSEDPADLTSKLIESLYGVVDEKQQSDDKVDVSEPLNRFQQELYKALVGKPMSTTTQTFILMMPRLQEIMNAWCTKQGHKMHSIGRHGYFLEAVKWSSEQMIKLLRNYDRVTIAIEPEEGDGST